MFKKLINKLTGNKKGDNKDKSTSYNTEELDRAEESNNLPSNVIRFNDYVERKKSKGNSNGANLSQSLNAENKKELERKTKELEVKKSVKVENSKKKISFSDKTSVDGALREKYCLECSASLSTRGKRSAVSDSGAYMYVCCSSCGCIMKLNDDGVLTSTVNILKEVSNAYVLFKRVNINPDSYSYTRNGKRHKF